MAIKNLILMERADMENKLEYGNKKIEFPKYPPTIASYYKYLNKELVKYFSSLRPNCKNIPDRSGIVPVNAYDIGNYLAKYGMASFQLQVIMKLDRRLGFDTLVKAVRLSLDVEPVLGCRFVKSNPPYWKRFDDIDNIKFCSIEETANSDEAVQRFLESSMNMDNDPMIMVRLIRCETYDTLCFKINHVCSDGAGVKDYIQLLSDIYSRIGQNDVLVLTPSERSRKDHDKLVNTLKECNPDTSWTPLQQTPLTTWSFPWKNMRIGSTGFLVCKLPYGDLDKLHNYAKSRGATINDLILTAIFRAMFEIAKPPYGIPMEIPITMDLRKYLPEQKAEAIRNFSGGYILRISRKANELFEGTLARVMAKTKDLKNRHPGLENAIKVDLIENMNFNSICAFVKAIAQVIESASQNPFIAINRCNPVLSNIGLISKSLLKFGEATVTDVYAVPPAIRAPGMLLVAGSYNGILTLTVGYYKPSVRKTDLEGLLNKIKDELIKGCTCGV